MRSFFNILFLLISTFCFAQKEASVWHFGFGCGLDFNYSPPQSFDNSPIFAQGGVASISDTSGNLLFYTDGQKVYNRNNKVMNNGSGLKGGSFVAMAAIIVPKPCNPGIYYVFTIGDYNYPKLMYNIVDMSKDSGRGDVISKNNLLLDSVVDKVTAVRHSNNRSVWVVTHKWKSNAFYAYEVNANGISSIPVLSKCGSTPITIQNRRGYMKISPDGKRLVAAVSEIGVEFFRFNNTTGTVAYDFMKYCSRRAPNEYYGIEYSPDLSKLYVTLSDSNALFQYDLNAGDSNAILNSRTYIAFIPGFVGGCQIGLNGKIYVTMGTRYLSVVNSPNMKGSACNFSPNVYYYPKGVAMYGLPDFIQSYFFFPNIKAVRLCLGDSTKLTLSDTSRIFSALWNFGDTASGTNNTSTSMSPAHVYTDTGLFKVTVYVYHSGIPDTLTREIRIGLYPTAYFTVNDTSQCIKANRFVFHDSSSIAVGGLSYEWNFGDSKKSFVKNPTHTYALLGIYQARLSVLSDYGCIATKTTNIYANPEPVSNFSVSDSIRCFKNNQFRFSDSSNISIGALSRVWKFGDKQSDTANFTVHSYSAADTFKATLIVSSNYGCKDSSFKLIIVQPSPVTSFDINDTDQCFKEQNFIITNKSYVSSGLLANTWYIDHDTFTSVNLQFTNLPIGTHMLKLITSTIQGCSDTTSKNIYVCPMPKASFTVPDTDQCYLYNSFNFTNTSTISSDTLYSLWDFGDNTNSTSASHIYKYHSTGSFRVKLTVTSPYGCSDSEIINVMVSPDAKISSVTNGSHCGPGQVFLQANALNGNISWYTSSVGGVLLDTGNLFTTDNLSSSATFYVEATNAGCASSRSSVQANIITIPSIISTVPQSRVGPGSVILTAHPSAGSVGWYDVPIGGNQLFSGSTFLTPFLSATTTFYAEAQYKGCSSYPRTAVAATLPNSINNSPDQVKIIIYPNPAHDYVILSVYGFLEPAKLEIRDVRGRLMKTVEIEPYGLDYNQKIDLMSFEQGIYNLILINKRIYKTFRIVKF